MNALNLVLLLIIFSCAKSQSFLRLKSTEIDILRNNQPLRQLEDSTFLSYEESETINEDDLIHFHIISHSHDDVGWLKTPQDYFSTYVRDIIRSVVQMLLKNPDRRFTQCEIYYFSKWYNEQTYQTKEDVKTLVSNGQLEFVNGGWASSDEACPTYEELIYNIMAGHAFLKSTFGIIPKHAWHLDAFGHSAVTPELFAKMGFETLTFARLDDVERSERMKQKALQFIWQPTYEGVNSPVESQKSIFVNALHKHYEAPCEINQPAFYSSKSGLKNHFDIQLKNFKIEIDKLEKCLTQFAEPLQTKHVMIMFGTDFSFQYADVNYEYLEAFMDMVSKEKSLNRKFKFFYSTVDSYFQAVKESALNQNITWPIHKSDFFPYNGQYPTSIWNGFYTSRPMLKQYIRSFTTLSQSMYNLIGFDTFKNFTDAKQHRDISRVEGFNRQYYNQVIQKIGEVTHHDTITGTSPKRVIYFEEEDLRKVQLQALDVVQNSLTQHLAQQEQIFLPQNKKLESCMLSYNERSTDFCLNKTQIIEDAGLNRLYIVYNTHSSQFKRFVSFITTATKELQASKWNSQTRVFEEAESEAFCYENPDRVQECEILVKVDVPPLQFSVLKLTYDLWGGLHWVNSQNIVAIETQSNSVAGPRRTAQQYVSEPEEILEPEKQCNSSISITNTIMGVQVDKCQDGQLTLTVKKFIDYKNALQQKVVFEFRGYDQENEESGVYVSTIKRGDSKSLGLAISHVSVMKTKRMEQIIFYIKHEDDLLPRSNIKIRLKQNIPYIEFDVELNQIFTKSNSMKKKTDITINWSILNVDNQGIFYTDANSYKVVRRNTSHDLSAPNIGSYFYPINSAIYIENQIEQERKEQFAIIAERPLAGSVYKPGRIEFIVNRQSSTHDGLGLNEPLQDFTYDQSTVNFTAKFQFVWTQSKQDLTPLIQKEHIRRMNRQQIFIGDGDKMVNIYEKEPNDEIFQTNIANIRSFSKYVKSRDIVDIQVVPPSVSTDRSIYFRVTRIPQVNKRSLDTAYDQQELKKEFCKYIQGDFCSILELMPTKLGSGNKYHKKKPTSNLSPVVQDGAEEELFIVEIYELALPSTYSN